ncbi:MAG: 30S ribosomal protein S2, partial [Anaerolineales bacterium]|nr:30S ribosomal protein S2 [Anaerolineales bacterium]
GLKKKERLMLEREINKLHLRLGGIRKMSDLPDALFIVDVNNEDTGVNEANKLDIPIVGMVDTNSDPERIDFVIPSNDDAIRAIKLIVGKMADAVLEGQAARKEAMFDDGRDDADFVDDEDFDGLGDEVDDEALLGKSTLAKIRDTDDAYDDDDYDEDEN